MPVTTLDPRTALVLIDLQKGIVGNPTAHPSDVVVERAAALAQAVRARQLPVFRLRVAFSPDGGDALKTRSDAQPPSVKRGPDFAEYDPRIPNGETDIFITKRQWDAFHGTELDLQLRRRKITGIIMAGISTSIGVESTARHGRELGYEIAFASDAMTDMVRAAHDNSISIIFPRIGQVDTTDAIVAALR
jgi:nicotinamidase-related amidase